MILGQQVFFFLATWWAGYFFPPNSEEYGHATFISVNSRKESLTRYLSSPVCPGLSPQFEQHYNDSVSSNSPVKNSPAKDNKISLAILIKPS